MSNPHHRITARNAPDRPVQQLAMWLDIMAGEVTASKLILAERIARAAGGAGGAGGSERVHTSRGSSTTETRAMAALHHDEQLAELAVAHLDDLAGNYQVAPVKPD